MGKFLPLFFNYDGNFGDVAQLARALRWQRRGRRFEPDILHKTIDNLLIVNGFFYEISYLLILMLISIFPKLSSV